MTVFIKEVSKGYFTFLDGDSFQTLREEEASRRLLSIVEAVTWGLPISKIRAYLDEELIEELTDIRYIDLRRLIFSQTGEMPRLSKVLKESTGEALPRASSSNLYDLITAGETELLRLKELYIFLQSNALNWRVGPKHGTVILDIEAYLAEKES